MRESFSAYLRQRFPEIQIHRPKFEPVVGAVILGLLHSGMTMSDGLLEMLGENYSAFGILED